MIKKRNSVKMIDLPKKPVSVYSEINSSSPFKIVRQVTRQKSTVNVTIPSQKVITINNPTQQVLQQCISVVQQIQQKHLEKKAQRFFHIRSCSVPYNRVATIDELIEQLLPKSPYKQNREAEIQSIIHQLIEEKQYKQKAINQLQNLSQKYQQSIVQLQSRIEEFSFL